MDLLETFIKGGRFDKFLDLTIKTQKETRDPSNLFRKSNIYYIEDKFSGSKLQNLNTKSSDDNIIQYSNIG